MFTCCCIEEGVGLKDFLACLNAVLPILIPMAIGYIAKKNGLIKRDDVTRINRILFNAFMPFLMFENIYASDLESAIDLKLNAFAVGTVILLFFAGIAFTALYTKDNNIRPVIAQDIFRSNYVIMGFPIVESLAGGADISQAVVLMATVVPTFNVLAVICLSIFGKGKLGVGKIAAQVALNPLVLGTAAGILFKLSGLTMPTALASVSKSMAGAVSPVILFSLGAFLEFKGFKKYAGPIAVTSLIRLVIVPALALSAAYFAGFRGVEFAALIGVFGSSAAINSFTMVQQMGGDSDLAGELVAVTSAACCVTLFGWCLCYKLLGI